MRIPPILILVCLLPLWLQAQIAGYSYKKMLKVKETSGIAKINHQVLFFINTKELIQKGQLRSDGADIRFSNNCEGTMPLIYYIESGLNTDSTVIWVVMPNLAASATDTIYMFHGDPDASFPPEANFVLTFPQRLIFSANDSLSSLDSILDYDWIEVMPNVTVKLDMSHQNLQRLQARRIKIHGKLDGFGRGYAGGVGTAGFGPGGGKPSQNTIEGFNLGGAGGGGYGGRGGNGAYCCGNASYLGPGGLANGLAANQVVDRGSGGGATSKTTLSNPGGNGGGGFILEGAYITIAGEINVNGADAITTETTFTSAGGGGSGGGIMIRGSVVQLKPGSILTAAGGNGGSATEAGGGGGGGRIKIFCSALQQNAANIIINGGNGGVTNRQPSVDAEPGSPGTVHISITYTSSEPQGSDLVPGGLLVSSVSGDTSCQSNPVTFTAIPGFGNYEFRINGKVMASGPANTFTTSSISNLDTVEVEVSGGACTYLSNPVVMTILSASPASVSITASADHVCPGTPITFTAAAVNPGLSPTYQWKINNTPVSGSNSSTFTASSLADKDKVECTMASSTQCAFPALAVSDILEVNIDIMVPEIKIWASDSLTCPGDSITFTSATLYAGGQPGFNWLINGISWGNASIFSSTGLQNGDTVQCELTSSEACAIPATVLSDPIIVNITTFINPILTISGPEKICNGTPVTFSTASVHGGTSPRFQWKLNGISIIGATAPQFSTAALTTADTLTCDMTSSYSCANPQNVSAQASFEIVPNAQVSAIGGPAALCEGTSAVYSVSASDSLQWFLNGNPIPGASTSTIALSPAAYDRLYVLVYSPSGCVKSSDTLTIIGKPTPDVPLISQDKACPGETALFSSGIFSTYRWKVNNIEQFGHTTRSFSYIPAEGDTITVEVGNGYCKSTSEAFLPAFLTAVPAIFSTSADTIDTQQPLELRSANNGATGYSWRFGDGTMGEGQETSHIYTSAGIFQITHYTVSEENCIDSSEQVVLVRSGVGIADPATHGFTILPNPASGACFLQAAQGGTVVCISLPDGRKIKELAIKQGSGYIDISDLPAGSYVMHIKTKEYSEVIRKLVVY